MRYANRARSSERHPTHATRRIRAREGRVPGASGRASEERARTLPFLARAPTHPSHSPLLTRVLLHLVEPDQYFPRLAPAPRPQDPPLLQLVDDPRGAAVPDPQPPLQQRGRPAPLLQTDLRRLLEEGIAIRAGPLLLRPPPRLLELEVPLLGDDVGLVRRLHRRAPRLVPPHHRLGLVGAHVGALDPHRLVPPRLQEEHVAIPQQRLGAVPVEDRAAVGLRRDAEGAP